MMSGYARPPGVWVASALCNQVAVQSDAGTSAGKDAIAVGTVGVRDLGQRASAVIADVEKTGQPTLVTRHGRPVAVLLPINEDDFYDYVLARAPEYVHDMREADAAIERGEIGKPLDQVLGELDTEGA